ncbi:Uncharacterized protein GBIM_17681, partial [Gryllus bimaculatus]
MVPLQFLKRSSKSAPIHNSTSPLFGGWGDFGFFVHLSCAVQPGSPADKADLEVGDEILEVNGKCLEDATHTEVISHIHQQNNMSSSKKTQRQSASFIYRWTWRRTATCRMRLSSRWSSRPGSAWSASQRSRKSNRWTCPSSPSR